MGKLARIVDDLDSLRFMMKLLIEIREKESSIDLEIDPVMDMYQMLEYYLPSGFMDKEEIDKKTMTRTNWKKLVALSLSRNDELTRTQVAFKSGLIDDIGAFIIDIKQVSKFLFRPACTYKLFPYRYLCTQFRSDFQTNGPLVHGIPPMDAIDRLSRFKEE